MGLTLTQIDRLLLDWQQKGDAANQNLLDLYDLPAYQRLNGMGNPPSNVTGVTQQRSSIALTALDRLFEEIGLLNQPIISAQKLRRELPTFFVNDQDLQEIYCLLTGQSIQLSLIQTPLEQRSLLSSSQQILAISPAELLDRMMANFADIVGMTMANEAVIADFYQLTNERMRLNFGARTDAHAFLYFDKWPDEAAVTQ